MTTCAIWNSILEDRILECCRGRSVIHFAARAVCAGRRLRALLLASLLLVSHASTMTMMRAPTERLAPWSAKAAQCGHFTSIGLL